MSAEDSNLAAADQRKENITDEDSKITGVRHKRPHVIRSLSPPIQILLHC